MAPGLLTSPSGDPTTAKDGEAVHAFSRAGRVAGALPVAFKFQLQSLDLRLKGYQARVEFHQLSRVIAFAEGSFIARQRQALFESFESIIVAVLLCLGSESGGAFVRGQLLIQ